MWIINKDNKYEIKNVSLFDFNSFETQIKDSIFIIFAYRIIFD